MSINNMAASYGHIQDENEELTFVVLRSAIGPHLSTSAGGRQCGSVVMRFLRACSRRERLFERGRRAGRVVGENARCEATQAGLCAQWDSRRRADEDVTEGRQIPNLVANPSDADMPVRDTDGLAHITGGWRNSWRPECTGHSPLRAVAGLRGPERCAGGLAVHRRSG